MVAYNTLVANPSLVLRPLERPGQPQEFLFKGNYIKTSRMSSEVNAEVFRHEVPSTHLGCSRSHPELLLSPSPSLIARCRARTFPNLLDRLTGLEPAGPCLEGRCRPSRGKPPYSFKKLHNRLKWTRTTDLTLIRRAL